MSSYVGLVYATAAACTLMVVFLIPRAITRFGIHATTGILSLVLFFVLAGIAQFALRPLILSLFILSYVLEVVVKFLLDLYVEHISDDSHTGRIRGLYLTIGNSAWLCAPIIAGILVEQSFAQVYAVAALVLVPALFIILYRLPHLHRFTIRETSLGDTLSQLWRARRGTHANVARALALDFFLFQSVNHQLVKYKRDEICMLRQNIKFSNLVIRGYGCRCSAVTNLSHKR